MKLPKYRRVTAAARRQSLIQATLMSSLNPSTFKPAEAVGLCEDWICALCAGAFPRLTRSAGDVRKVRKRTSRAR